jgi:outer membrane immunogenic protein
MSREIAPAFGKANDIVATVVICHCTDCQTRLKSDDSRPSMAEHHRTRGGDCEGRTATGAGPAAAGRRRYSLQRPGELGRGLIGRVLCRLRWAAFLQHTPKYHWGSGNGWRRKSHPSVESKDSSRFFGGDVLSFSKRIFSASLAGSALFAIGAASAADLPVKAPPAAVAVAKWTGFYLGVNGGGSIGVDSTTQNTSFTSTALGTNGLLNSSNRLAPTGWVFGGQVGYNWQASPLAVLGVEADWQWASQKDTATNSTPPASLAFFGAGGNGFGYSLATEQKVTDIGTARMRGGVLLHDTLLYATGGLAWGTVKDSYTYTGSANPVIFPGVLQPGPFLPGVANFSSTRTGGTAGAGMETKLGGGWSAKLEYLYVDLGTVNHVLPIAINQAAGPAFNTGGAASAATSFHVTDNIVRVGVNYQFGSTVAAKY